MDCGLLSFACDGLADIWQGATAYLFGWLYAIQWWMWFVAGLMIGSVLGAMFGWLAPISFGISILVGLFAGRGGGTTQPSRVETEREPEPTPRVPRKPKTLIDLFRDSMQKTR